jgi:HK97 family phage major capsid protein
LGLFTIFGYPVHVIDQMADGSTAGDNSVYFGDMARGLAVVSRRNLEISRFMETKPGMVTYFGDVRSKAAAWDVNALVSLNTGA